MSLSDVNVAYGILSIIFAAVLLFVIPQHVRIQNTGTILMAVWGFVGLLSQGINAFLFRDTTYAGTATIRWCDLSGALGYAWPFGFAAGTLAVVRRLESIASTRQVSQTPRGKRIILVVDLIIGIACPLLLILLHYCVQGHRIDLVGNYGCVAPLYFSIPALLVFSIWQVVINAASFVYAVLVLRWFILRRRQFAAILHSSGSGMSQRRYLRLMALASFEILLTFPVSLYIFISNATKPLQPWTGWALVHYDFNYADSIMIEDLPSSHSVPLQIGRWLGIIAVLVFLCFFGPNKEYLSEVSSFATQIFKRFKHKEITPKVTAAQTGTIQHVFRKTSSGNFEEESTTGSWTGELCESHELKEYDGASIGTEQERSLYDSEIFVEVERTVA